MESPGTHTFEMQDVPAIAAVARKYSIVTMIDNTYATLINFQLLKHGVDVVVHSATKYINGHSDMVGGVAVVGANPELAERLKYLQNAVGGISGPFDAFLALRGLKTLSLRMERHSDNAQRIATDVRAGSHRIN